LTSGRVRPKPVHPSLRAYKDLLLAQAWTDPKAPAEASPPNPSEIRKPMVTLVSPGQEPRPPASPPTTHPFHPILPVKERGALACAAAVPGDAEACRGPKRLSDDDATINARMSGLRRRSV
jgi:hypothetical protein